MKRSKLLAGAIALLPAAGLLAISQLADAHYPTIEATAVCVDTEAQITIKVTSWQTDENAHRQNANISVSWDGVPVASGSFTPANGYAFTVAVMAPADGAAHTIVATAVAPFGPSGEFGFAGTTNETTVTLPKSCAPVPTTAPPTTAPPTTTVQQVVTEVLGTTVTRADVATPVEVLPRFAG